MRATSILSLSAGLALVEYGGGLVGCTVEPAGPVDCDGRCVELCEPWIDGLAGADLVEEGGDTWCQCDPIDTGQDPLMIAVNVHGQCEVAS